MVDWKALKLVALAMAGMVAFLLAGAALRFASRILSFALLALLVVAAGYVLYELVSGWTAAEADDRTAHRDAEDDDVDEHRDQYVEAELSESEFERELAAIVDDESESDESAGVEEEPAFEIDEET